MTAFAMEYRCQADQREKSPPYPSHILLSRLEPLRI